MQLMDSVVVGNTNTHKNLAWIVGVVTAIDTVAKTCTVAFGPEPTQKYVSGVGLVGVPRLDQYTPVLGDIVHMLSQEVNGMLILGSAGRVTLNQVLPPGGGGPEPAPTVFTADGAAASENEVVQGSQVGSPQYWYFPTLSDIITQADALGTITAFIITVTLLSDGPAAAFVLTSSGDTAAGFDEPFYSVALTVGVPTAVGIPLGWATEIELNESYSIGVEAVGRAQYAVFDMAASIEIQVQKD